jgi:triosephosphate isomerase
MTRRYLVAGNWKMNASGDANRTLIQGIAAAMPKVPAVEVLVCPPYPYLDHVRGLIGTAPIALGAQNLSEQEKAGAFTGEVHGTMLKEFGCTYVIVGHSERRALYWESDQLVAAKVVTAQKLGLVPILCVGETLEERDSNRTEAVLQRQIDAVIDICGIAAFDQVVIAYEPVWAIGTGRTATPAQAQEAHAFLRGRLAGRDAKIADRVRILYGGSVKADNAAELFAGADVDGGLIGGASLKSGDFNAICAAAQARVS